MMVPRIALVACRRHSSAFRVSSLTRTASISRGFSSVLLPSNTRTNPLRVTMTSSNASSGCTKSDMLHQCQQQRWVSSALRHKVASKRLRKNYKLKNHNGAAARWLMVGNGQFLRRQAGANHFNRKMRAWKRSVKRKPVFATKVHRKLLRQVIPYWKKKYSRKSTMGINTEYLEL